jgi:hypothetical protein
MELCHYLQYEDMFGLLGQIVYARIYLNVSNQFL